MNKRVRVRFAPSPTGGLHLGGVRTVLYNYLFAKQLGGDFILRIEDTDQSRYVAGAEQYIFDTLKWCGLEPDESPVHGGNYGPYRQSERKSSYRKYAEELVSKGLAYYAFDTSAELDEMRSKFQTDTNPSPQYDHNLRMQMRNSLIMPADEVKTLLDADHPHVIRIKMPENETISFNDMIRGTISFETALIDDKVLLKADGMPTYHLAVVVDDYLMKISHAFRGEEWLPSAPVHILLWKHLFGSENMPEWAHLPLILGPSGKLSKRDGAKYGFPVFAMTWTDPVKNETTEGFRENGFVPEAFVNLLALLGWNDGSDQELFSLEELVQKFSIAKVHKGGAKFDFEKAKWFNHEWLKKLEPVSYLQPVKEIFIKNGIAIRDDAYLEKVIALTRDRCHLLSEFLPNAKFFFERPVEWDADAIKSKWTGEKKNFFHAFAQELSKAPDSNAAELEERFKSLAASMNIKPGELQLPFRIMLVGGKFGPGVFAIAELLGAQETILRIENGIHAIQEF
jgi:glutamyl-tRNA synthetase